MSTPPGMPPGQHPETPSERALLRASSADRDRVTEILTAAYREGRLTDDEYMDRAASARAAVTYADLDRLLVDLPTPGALTPVPAPPAVPVQPPPGTVVPARSGTQEAWRTWAVVSGICTLIWLITAVAARSPLYFWPMWVAGPWGLVLLFTSFRRG